MSESNGCVCTLKGAGQGAPSPIFGPTFRTLLANLSYNDRVNSILRCSFLMATVGGTALSMASFDLMLLPGNDGRIYRYDPVNRLNLGSYLSTSYNMMIAADTDGVSYSGSSGTSSVLAHRYSTGENLGQFSVGSVQRAMLLRSGSLYSLNSTGQVRRYSTANGSLLDTVTLPANIVWRTMARIQGNLIAVGTNTSNQLSFQNISTADLSLGILLTSTITSTASSALGKADVATNALNGFSTLAFTYLNAGGLYCSQFLLNPSGYMTSTTSSTIAIGGSGGFNDASDLPAVVAGHSGLYIYGQDATTPTTVARLSRLDFIGSFLNTTNTTTFTAPGGSWDVNNPGWHPANIVAPEPGSLMACGAGLLALLRRRKPRA